MQTYQSYKGYGITYYSMSGTTIVDKYGFEIKVFSRLGEMDGENKAKIFIDSL